MRLTVKRTTVAFLAVFAALAVCPTVPAEDGPIKLRHGTPNVFHYAGLHEGVGSFCLSDAVPSFEGGPVGEMPVFVRYFGDICRQWFPKTHFGVNTYSCKPAPESAEPGSYYAAYSYARVGATIGNKIGGSHLGFIDLARSDLDKTEQQILDGLEGIVRQSYHDLDLVFVYSPIPAFVNSYLEGKTHPVIAVYERVAEHYNIASLDLAKNGAAKIKAGEITAEDYLKCQRWCGHNWHMLPAGEGNVIDSALFKEFVEQCYAARPENPEARYRPGRDGVSPTNLERAGGIAYDWAEYDKSAWQEGSEPVEGASALRTLLTCTKPGAVCTLKFTGSRCGWSDILARDSADMEYRIDGGAWTPVHAYEGSRLEKPIRRNLPNLAVGLDPNVEHRLELRVAENQTPCDTPRIARIGVFLIDGWSKNPFDGHESRLDYINAVYAKMLPVTFPFSPERWKHLPKTMDKLQNGGTLRIVMLGDSIIQDSAASSFELLLGKMYPKCKIELIVSTRGSTGCWYYKDNNMVEPYVLQHKPDLLMIGGISNSPDLEDIRSVVKQVRAKQDPEIMLMTKVVGTVEDMQGHTFEISDDPKDYRNWMRRVAAEEKCEFVDLTGPFVQYIRDTGSHYGWFMRDGVHANDRGSQIIGRLLFNYFSPKENAESAK